MILARAIRLDGADTGVFEPYAGRKRVNVSISKDKRDKPVCQRNEAGADVVVFHEMPAIKSGTRQSAGNNRANRVQQNR